ncbi:MAG: formylglycine-generating enzyme family protein [Sedimentitalea sp.]
MKQVFLAALLTLAAGATHAQTPDCDEQIHADWPVEFYDPAAVDKPADLILPMPYGAAMAFQRVTVPVEADDPLADRRVRLGQSLDQTGYSDYLHPAFLRGSFAESESGGTHYYIARYELTQGQYRVLMGDCKASSRRDRLAQGDLSWFDAVEVGQLYSQWLYQTRPAQLPRADDALGFARLPTESEWEYATRGGARVDANLFPGLMFFAEGELREYARYKTGSGKGRLGPIGLLKPNPLGLFDVYGNAEELMLEPFRLNAVGRIGGQIGGIVTRGGSALSSAEQIYSAQRTEWPPFDVATNGPLKSNTFGMRLVLATHIATSNTRLDAIQTRWSALAQGDADETEADPAARLTGLIEAEVDPRRQQALSDLQLEFRRSRDRAQTALQQSARATLLAGAVFVASLDENHGDIENKAANIRMLVSVPRENESAFFQRQVDKHVTEIAQMRELRSTYLLSFRAALETLSSDIAPAIRASAYNVLRAELELSERGEIVPVLDRFWADLEIYGQRPDITPEDLLRVALD